VGGAVKPCNINPAATMSSFCDCGHVILAHRRDGTCEVCAMLATFNEEAVGGITTSFSIVNDLEAVGVLTAALVHWRNIQTFNMNSINATKTERDAASREIVAINRMLLPPVGG
jgi:hypothetical protein